MSTIVRRRSLRHVWRHLPLNDVHPNAQWRRRRPRWRRRLVGLDTDRFWGNCAATNMPGEWQTTWRVRMRRRGRSPTFFIKAKRHHGAYDVATLTAAVRAARAHGLSVWRHAVVSAAR
jgi:hypothetical protein